MPSAPPSPSIVFFDGVCGLCNGFVDALLRLDRRRRLRFAPLQGETARGRLAAPYREGLGAVVLLDECGISERSEAVLRILSRLGQPWRTLACLGRVIPRRWRDRLYDAIAARRYRWFGQRDTCRVPTPQEREQFLD
jgi:predicted DCC family thiol-disulfide oxidoreductase YuxK